MSDIRDHTTDDLEARLVRALHLEADAHEPIVPSMAAIRAGAQRQARRRQLEIGSAVLVAAAIIVVLIVGPWRGSEDAYVDSGPTTTTPPLHLQLDPAAGYEIAQASTYRLDAEGQPPGTVPGPEGRSTFETIAFAGPDPLRPPWFVVRIRSMENPTGPWGDFIASNEKDTTVGGRPARFRSAGISPTPGTDPPWSSVGLKWDDHHEVTAQFWDLPPDAAAEALASLRQDESGRWVLESPPAGLQELARDLDADVAEGWYQDVAGYQDPDAESFMTPTLSITRVPRPLSEGDLIISALNGTWDGSPVIERTAVRGQPALVVSPSAGAGAGLGTVPRYRVIWFEPDHDVAVDLTVYDTDRPQVDRAIASIREVDDAEWRATLATCTDVPSFDGTVRSLPPTATGGPCPGGVLQIGG